MIKKSKPTIAFICIENSCRSQIAEAFANMLNQETYEIISGGSQPSSEVNSNAVKLMAELGYDMSLHKPKSINNLEQVEVEILVSMGCGEACPNLYSKRKIDWEIPDPKKMSLDEFREIRDSIKGKVESLFEELLKN